MCRIRFLILFNIQGEAHKVLQSDSTQTIDYIQKYSDKIFSVREGRHTGPPYFFIGAGAEATSRSTPLS